MKLIDRDSFKKLFDVKGTPDIKVITGIRMILMAKFAVAVTLYSPPFVQVDAYAI